MVTDSPGKAPARPKRGNLMSASCPSRQVLQHMTNRWGPLVLLAPETGTLRFSQLRRAIGGVSERMLAQTLQELEGDGLINRIAYEVVPPHVEYSLTPLGKEATERVRAVADWIETSLPPIGKVWDSRAKSGKKN
uniref:winged helix-turn-helix transcriptional regulator n=2 Tax=Mesorhizobium sp. L-8-10 TaxID=2744523 RepID=UPI00192596E6|nr:helix-turn-helix domain-containing protein [Mesorhizobium sp. L-8-10]